MPVADGADAVAHNKNRSVGQHRYTNTKKSARITGFWTVNQSRFPYLLEIPEIGIVGKISFPNAELGSLCPAQKMHDENMSDGSERRPIVICTEGTDTYRAIYFLCYKIPNPAKPDPLGADVTNFSKSTTTLRGGAKILAYQRHGLDPVLELSMSLIINRYSSVCQLILSAIAIVGPPGMAQYIW